jgi:hypothetical protein
MRRRAFIKVIAGSAAAWPIAAHAQQAAIPVVGFINAASAQNYTRQLAAFLKGLGESGYVDGRNVARGGSEICVTRTLNLSVKEQDYEQNPHYIARCAWCAYWPRCDDGPSAAGPKSDNPRSGSSASARSLD